jgi:CRP-like cAMP-binding protein
MAKPPHPRINSVNALLTQLPREQFADLFSELQLVELEVRQVLYEPNRAIRYAYFPESGMVSIVAFMEDGASIEVGTIGQEGMIGGMIVMESDRVPHRYFVQVAGRAHRIEASWLKEASDRQPLLRKLILRYEADMITQSMQLIACNGMHSIHQRCCRWLLMACDRSATDEIPLTHEFLALMLGVRRASVSDVLRPLQEAGLIRSARGHITILDRKGLEAGSCECYRAITERQRPTSL